MSKTFRAWHIDQPQLLPPTVQDFVAKDHLANFVVGLVKEQVKKGQSATARVGAPRARSHWALPPS
jgi:hypothetical protein